jgi:hypothetical protein
MMDFVNRVVNQFLSSVTHFDRQQWMWISVAVIVVGFMCMRGFGSRTNY